MSKRIYCIAEFAPKDGCEQELFEALMTLEPLALREDGCIRYKVTRQINQPGASSPSKFSIMFNEEWADMAAFNSHSQQAYVVDFFNKYLQNPETALATDCSVRIFSDNQ